MVDKLSAELDITKNEAGRYFDAFVGAAKESLATDGTLAIPGFGNFKVNQRNARTGRNPATGDEIQIPAKKVVGFKAAAALNTEINE